MKRFIAIGLACVLMFGTSALARSNDDVVDARTWSPGVPLSIETLPSAQSEPALAVNGAHTIVVWTDSRNTSPDIYASAMLNGSKPADSRVTNIGPQFDTQHVFGASVALEPSGRAFVAYSDGAEIYVARYDVASGQWLSRTQVTSGLNNWEQVAKYPAIASDGSGNLAIVWEDFRNANPNNNDVNNKGSDIYAATCNGNAMTCVANAKVNDDSALADQRRPRLSRNGNNVVVVWEDHRERGAELPRVYAAVSTNGGQNFGANMRVSKSLTGNADVNSRDAATMPAVTYAPDGTAFATWENHIGWATAPADIYAAQWNGSSWGNPVRVDRAPNRVRSVNPSVGSSSAGTFVAWQDYRNGLGNPDVYAARLDGTTWNETGAAVLGGMQTRPAVFAQGDMARLAWQDSRTGHPDVYLVTWNGSAWTNATQINESADRASYQMAPSTASSGGATYAAILDSREGYKQLWLQQLVAQPGTPRWAAAIPFPTRARDDGDVSTQGADILFDNAGKLHAVWSEYVYPVGRQIQYSAYANAQWSDPVSLSGSATDTDERFAPAIAARGAALAVVWSFRGGNNRSNLYASFNTMGTWSAPVTVMQNEVDEYIIPSSIAIDANNTVFVAYSLNGTNGRSRVFVARRSLTGGAWSYAQVSPDVNSDWCQQLYPQVRVGNDNKVHVVWSGCALRNPPTAWPHDSYVFYASSTNGGVSFSTPVKVGLTIAQNDAAFDNDTSSRPALAIGGNNEAMVLYPSRVAGTSFAFYASLISNGVPAQPAMVSGGDANWTRPNTYFGDWYDGDSKGAVVYDAAQLRFVVTYPDRRNGRSPRLYSAAYGDISLRRIYLPLVRR